MFWQLWVIFFSVVILWLAIDRWRQRRIFALSKQTKSDIPAFPVFGHVLSFLGDGTNRMRGLERIGRDAIKYGGITHAWLGNSYYIVPIDPYDLEVLLKSSLSKGDIASLPRALLGYGSIFAPVSIWRPRRKVLAPTFSLRNLHSFEQIFSTQSQIMVKKLKGHADGDAFSIWPYITTYAMDAVCETALGVKVNAQSQKNLKFLSAFEKCCQITAMRSFRPWLQNETFFKITPSSKSLEKNTVVVWNFVDKVIKDKRIELEEKKRNNTKDSADYIKTFLELLIESSGGDKGYTDLELREETTVIVLAGTDTSAVGMAFTVMMLAKYPDVQEKVYQEIRSVIGDTTRPITVEDLPYFKYLEAVIKESLRVYPPVPITVRQVEKDVELPSGLTVVEGVGVLLNVWAVHRNPKYWGEDADEFRPERFLDTPLKHPAQYVPFSHGPRNCLGYQYALMSMKTVMATLLCRYKVLNKDPKLENVRDESPLRTEYSIMMKDIDHFTVRIQNRH